MQQRLAEVQQELDSELMRLSEAKRAGDAAERHATDVRRQVQREAKRVAELAAAAVLAAAARRRTSRTTGGDDDAEQPAVAAHRPERAPGRPARSKLRRTPPPGKVTASAKVTVPPAASRVGADAD